MRYSFKNKFDKDDDYNKSVNNIENVTSSLGSTYKGVVKKPVVEKQVLSNNQSVLPQPMSSNKGVSSGTPSFMDKVRAGNNRANQAYVNSLPTPEIINRGDNIVKGVATSTAASLPLVAEGTKQTLRDWQEKVKTQGIQSAMDDYTYNLDNPTYSFGKPIDTNSKAYQNYARSQEYYNKALEGLSPAQQKAGQLGISMLESAATLPTAFINPSAPLALMGMKSAANRTYELTNQGKTSTEATGRGILSGLIEAGTEMFSLDNLLKVAKLGGKPALKNMLKQMGTEGSEELASYIMNYAADVSAGDENAQFSPQEALENFAGGVISGGIMGGIGSAIGNYTDSRMDSYNQNAPGKADYNKVAEKMMLPEGAQYMPSVEPYKGVTNGEDILRQYVNDYNQNVLGQPLPTPPTQQNLSAQGDNSVVNQLKNNINNLSDMSSVKVLSGNEFSKNDSSLISKVLSYITDYTSKNGPIKREGFGEILITKRGLKSSTAHGIGREKAAAFVAVPEVLKHGKQIGFQNNWKNRGYDTYLFAAPVTINNEKTYVGVIVKKNPNTNSYYLHEVVDSYGNIIKTKNGDAASTSTDISARLKSSPIDISKSDGTSPNTIISNISENYNNNLGQNLLEPLGKKLPYLEMPNLYENASPNQFPKYLGEKMPGIESIEQNSKNNLGIVNPDSQQLMDDFNTAKGKGKRFYQGVVSGWAPFEGMAKADTNSDRNIIARVNKYAQKGGISDTILTRGLYDRNGNKVSDKSFIGVVSQVPKADFKAFNDYLQNLHNISRQAQGKPVNANTAEESLNIAAQYEAQHPEFKKYQQELADYWDKFSKVWLVDSGLISAESYANLKEKYPFYMPTFRTEYTAGGSGGYARGKKITGGTGIGKAKGGTSEVLSFEEAFAKKIQSVISAATKNDISQEIYGFAQDMPSEAAKNGILLKQEQGTDQQFSDLDDLTDAIDSNIAKEISKGKYEITFYKEGKPVTMQISKEVWDAYNFLDSRLGDNWAINGLANLGRTFTNPMRAMTTTYNPLFFMTNIIRDLQTYTINNTASNSAVAAKNYVKALAGMIRQADTYNQYKSMGGSQNGYVGSDMYKKTESRVNPNKTLGEKMSSVLRSPLNGLEFLGSTTETLPRYAEYLNTIDRTGNTDAGRLQASLNAADVTVNFNRSSTLSTLANAWIPYFNAGLQGMDKTIRQIKAYPVKTTTRAAATVLIPTIILYAINKDNPHWKDVKDGVRDNYYLIPNMNGPIDLYGNAETFIRIPKSREYGALMSASFERFVRALDDEMNTSDAFAGYGETLLNSFMPPDLGDWIGGTYTRLKNNTAWHGGTIVPSNLEDVSPQYQYDINTSGAAMKLSELGQKLPIPGELGQALSSPMKMDYLIDSYTGYAGDVLQGLTSQKNKGNNGQETLSNSLYSGAVQPFKNRLTTDSAFSSYTLDNFYNKSHEAKVAANDKNYADNLPSDYVTAEETISSAYTKAQGAISDLTKQEKAVLASPMPIKEKNNQIRELRKQKNAIAEEMKKYPDILEDTYNFVYTPAVMRLETLPAYDSMNQEQQGKVLTEISQYASDIAKSRIYPNVFYPTYVTPSYLPKVRQAVKSGIDSGEAIFYRYKLSEIEKNAEKGEDKNRLKREYLEKVNNLTAPQKNAIDEAFITDYTYIPQDINVDYSNHTSTILTQMSDSAQNKWYRFDNMGLPIDDYDIVYAAATKGTKAERLENLQSLGYTYSEALSLYKAATQKVK